jgi:hypothetical protein
VWVISSVILIFCARAADIKRLFRERKLLCGTKIRIFKNYCTSCPRLCRCVQTYNNEIFNWNSQRDDQTDSDSMLLESFNWSILRGTCLLRPWNYNPYVVDVTNNYFHTRVIKYEHSQRNFLRVGYFISSTSYSIGYGPTYEADSPSASQEITHLLRTSKIYYTVRKTRHWTLSWIKYIHSAPVIQNKVQLSWSCPCA